MSARGRIGRFVRGVAIHEFIRDRICTWQPELLVIKTRHSPRVLRLPRERGKSKRFSGRRRRRRIMYAEEAIRARAALSPFPPKHVVSNVFNFPPRPARSFLYGGFFFCYSSDYCHRRVRDPASGLVASLPLNRESSTVIQPVSVVPPLVVGLLFLPLFLEHPGHHEL